MTADELADHCRAWQQRLRLQDWEVQVTPVVRGAIGHADVYGKIEWSLHSRSAKISIVVSVDMAENDACYDPEMALVHELLHLYFLAWGTVSDTLEDTALEQGLWAISRALIAAYRPS